mgnify:CR=1 FL=1
MNHKIAILSDIHGNVMSLEAELQNPQQKRMINMSIKILRTVYCDRMESQL